MAQDPALQAYIDQLRRQRGQAPTQPTSGLGAGVGQQSVIEPESSTFGTLLDWLNRTANASASGALARTKGGSFLEGAARGFKGGDTWQQVVPDEERHTYEEVLGAQGVAPGWKRSIAGFAGDVLLDPTTYIPGAALAKVATTGGKGLKAAGNLAAKIPGVGKAIETGINYVVPFREIRNLPEIYQKLAKVRNMETRASRSLAFHDVENALRPLLQAVKKSGGDVEDAMKQAMRVADTSDANVGLTSEVQDIVKYIQQFGKDRATKEVAGKVLDPASIRANYVPKEFIRPSVESTPQVRVLGRAGFQQEAPYKTFAQAEKAGKEVDYNLLRVLGRRQQAGERALAHQRFADALLDANAPQEIKDLIAKTPKGGWTSKNIPKTADGRDFMSIKVPILDHTTREAFQTLAFHPDVAKDIERMLIISQRPDEVANTFDKIMNIWKTSATVVRPAFIERNILSNVFMTLAGGETSATELPKYYKMAFQALRNPAKAMANPDFVRARELGITSTEFGAIGELGTQAKKSIHEFTKTPFEQALNPKGMFTAYPRAMRSLSKGSEDLSRLALFFQQRDRGKSAEDAALHVNKWLINYAEKTEAERKVLSKIFPFTTWMNRIVPLITEGMIRNPKLFSAQEKLKKIMDQRVPADERMRESERPGWMQQQEFFQLPGVVKNERRFGSFGLPGPDINIIPSPFGTSLPEAVKELAGRVSPLKAPFEAWLNRNVSTGGDVWKDNFRELRPAGGITSLIGAAAPGPAQHLLGMAQKGTDAWYAPAALNHVLSQLMPPMEQVGKMVRTSVPGQIPEGDPQRVGKNLLWAAPSIQRDTDVDYARRVEAEKQRRLKEAKDLAFWLDTQRRRLQGK